MHSRIFQIDNKPIDPYDYIEESNYYDGFVGSVADYVDTIKAANLKDHHADFGEFLAGAATVEGKKITITDKQAYFKQRYASFMEHLKELSEMTLEQFCDDAPMEELVKIHSALYQLKESYDEKFSIYVDVNHGDPETMDSFMRTVENGDVYYLGGVMDYHY